MNWNQVKGNWKQIKGKAKQMWGELTDDELDVIEGKRDKLIGQLQAKYGLSKARAEKQADEWATRLGERSPMDGPHGSGGGIDD